MSEDQSYPSPTNSAPNLRANKTGNWKKEPSSQGRQNVASNHESIRPTYVVERLMMNQVIARVNIRHYRETLLSDIGPEERSRLHKLLVEEEDKLGKDLNLLADIERHIAEGARRIEAQQSRLCAMQADGRDGVERAQAFLDGLMESQRISMKYRELVKKEIERNRLLAWPSST